MKGFQRPFESEKGFLKKLQGDVKKCPFCGGDLGKVAFIKREAMGFCKCKNCGEKIVDAHIVW